MRLFSFSLYAMRRVQDKETDVSIIGGMALIRDDEDVQSVGEQRAHELFPASDGWYQHGFIPYELEPTADFGLYTVRWVAVEGMG